MVLTARSGAARASAVRFSRFASLERVVGVLLIAAGVAACGARAQNNEPDAGGGAQSGGGGSAGGAAGMGAGGAGAPPGIGATPPVGGGDEGGGGTGTGGGGAGGGGTGGGGTGGGGTGTGGMLAAFPPACVGDLEAACALEGPCVFELTAQGRRLRECYAGGVTIEYEYTNEPNLCMPGEQTTARVHKAGGELCYTKVTKAGAGCESTSTTWSDGVGQEVARENREFPGTWISISCTESLERSQCATPCAAWARPSCVEGTCPEPLE
jgi:hypothetical protein